MDSRERSLSLGIVRQWASKVRLWGGHGNGTENMVHTYTLCPHDLTLGPHDLTLGPHDLTTLGSHDLTLGPHDLTLGPRDLTTLGSHDNTGITGFALTQCVNVAVL